MRDHQRWPNAYFAEQGLLSLEAAHVRSTSILDEVNHQLESRMREIRQSGSEGGGAETNRLSLPLFGEAANGLRSVGWT